MKNQNFNLVAAPSSAVTTIGYAKDTGAVDVIGVGQDVLDAF